MRFSNEAYEEPDIKGEDIAILQFTSGTARDPRAVINPFINLIRHTNSIIAASGFNPEEDMVISWLPLYHDMGLIGLLVVPLLTGVPLLHYSPLQFLFRSISWFELAGDFKATTTAGPNFAYALIARALRERGET